MPKFLVGAGLVLLLGLAAIAVWLDRPPAPSTIRVVPPVAGGTTPTAANASAGAIYAAKFKDLAGVEQPLGRWEQKLLVVNFWATWCGPCKEEMPMLSQVHARFAARGLQVVGIAADSTSNVANFAKNTNISYPLLVDEAGAIELSRRLGNRLGLLPFTAVFRPGGELVFTRLGVLTEAELVEFVDKNL